MTQTTESSARALCRPSLEDVTQTMSASLGAIDRHIDALRDELEKATRVRRAMAEAVGRDRDATGRLSSVLQGANRADYETPPEQKMRHQPPATERAKAAQTSD